MILAGRFVVLHMPRTGGTWLHHLMTTLVPRPYEARGYTPTHIGYLELPEGDRGKPALIMVRDPWSWYVSFYHHARRPMLVEQGAVEDWAQLPFAQAIREIEGCAEYFERLTRGAPEGQLHVGRFERVRQELVRLFGKVAPPVPPALVQALQSWPRMYQASYQAVASYYPPELRDWVAERDAGYIERFGFRFPGS